MKKLLQRRAFASGGCRNILIRVQNRTTIEIEVRVESKVIRKLRAFEKVLIIGPFPPPLGGVSVHIYRLCKQLDNCVVFDTSAAKGAKVLRYLALCYRLLSSEYRVVHVHYFNVNLLAILYILKTTKKFTLIATVHNPRLFQAASTYRKAVLSRFLSKLDILVAVSDEIIRDFSERGIGLPSEIIVEPAYLQPPAEDEASIIATYPDSLLNFISTHTPIISANAYALTFHEGIDLYGLESCIELTQRLAPHFPDVGFLFALADDRQNKNYLQLMRNKIAELGLADRFYIMTGQTELWPILRRIDVLVRPTCSDGDAVSVREALNLGKSVVASDVAHRPVGTALYRFGDAEDLYAKVKESIERNR